MNGASPIRLSAGMSLIEYTVIGVTIDTIDSLLITLVIIFFKPCAIKLLMLFGNARMRGYPRHAHFV